MGARGSADALVVLARPARPGQAGRVGFTVPKKVGKAHERNLVKRRLRHLMRYRPDALARADLVIIARAGAAALSFDELAAALDGAVACALEEMRRRRGARPASGRPRGQGPRPAGAPARGQRADGQEGAGPSRGREER
jgi:ribonuclease P protein component